MAVHREVGHALIIEQEKEAIGLRAARGDLGVVLKLKSEKQDGKGEPRSRLNETPFPPFWLRALWGRTWYWYVQHREEVMYSQTRTCGQGSTSARRITGSDFYTIRARRRIA